MAQGSVLDNFDLPNPDAILANQNAGIEHELTGTLAQKGSAVGQLFSRMLAGNPQVQQATAIRQAARDSMTGVGPQGANESDIDYQLRTTHAMYQAVAPFDTNSAMKLADRLVLLKQAQDQQSFLKARGDEETQKSTEERQTKGTLVVGNPKTGDEYGTVRLFNDDGSLNPDWQTQRDKMLSANKGSVWRTEEQWASEKAALSAQKMATQLLMKQMGQTNNQLDPNTLEIEAQSVLRNPQMLRQYASFGAAGQDMRNQIMGRVSGILKDAGVQPGEWYSMTAMIRGQQVAIDKLAPLLAQTQAQEGVAINNADRIEALMGKVNTSQFSSINGLIQWAGKQKGNADAAELSSVMTTFQMEAARLLTASPSGAGVVSDSARRELAQVADGTLAPAAMKRVLERVKFEIGLRVQNYKDQMEASRQYISNVGGTVNPAQPGPQPNAPGVAAAPVAAPSAGMPSASDIDAEIARRAGK